MEEEDERFKRMKYDPKFLPIDGRVKTMGDERFKRVLNPDFSMLGDREVQKSASKAALLDLYAFGSEKEPVEDDKKEEEGEENVVDLREEVEFQPRKIELPLEYPIERDDFQDADLLREIDESQKETRAFDLVEMSLSAVPECVESSNRFAIVNHDFSVVPIKELFVLFTSFCREQPGNCVKITQYYSKKGEKMIAKDLASAPDLNEIYYSKEKLVELKDQKRKEMEIARRSEEGMGNNRPKLTGKIMKAKLTTREKVDTNKVVLYEMEKLKYFIAIAEFTDSKTCEFVYDQCNGVDFEDTQQYLDLQIVPSEKSFEDYIIVEGPLTANEVNVEEFVPQERGRSTVFNQPETFTWDKENQARSRALSGNDNVPEEEILKYVNLSDSDEEDEEELQRIRQLLLLPNDDEDEGEDDKDEQDMEVTIPVYNTEENQEIQKKLNELLLDQKKAKEETYHETRKRRRKEEKKKRRKQRQMEQNMDDEDDDDQVEDNTVETEKLRELLRKGKDDESNELEYDLRADRQREMQRIEKGNEQSHDTGFDLDVHSSRFDKLLSDPDFNIDPTSKKFRKTKNYETIVSEKRKRKKRKRKEDEEEFEDTIVQERKKQKNE